MMVTSESDDDHRSDSHDGLRTVKDAMKFLRVGRDTIYRLSNRGELHMIRVGTRGTRITQASLDAYVKNAKRVNTKRQ